MRGAVDHQQLVGVLKRCQRFEVHGGQPDLGMPYRLAPAAVELDVALASQSCEFLIAGDEFGDEVGQRLILRMRGPRGAQVSNPFPYHAFAVDGELACSRVHQAKAAVS